MSFAGRVIAIGFMIFVSVRCAAQQGSPPRITGYVAVVHPLVTYGDTPPHYNFDGSYTVGFPVGLNVWKKPALAFSLELVPTIRAANGTSKMTSLLVHPGVLFGLHNGFAITTRAAFETSGRYGVTVIPSKILKRTKENNFFVALPLPARFGNSQAATFTVGLELGMTF